MWTSLIVFSFLGLSSANIQQGEIQPVKVTVFYESLCPDSIRFITRQLEPVYANLSSIMAVDVYAFGKAKSEPRPGGDGYTFQCQHGAAECEGNKALECAKKYITNHDSYLNFTFCVMAADNPSIAGEQCAIQLGFEYGPISNCTTSSEGENLLHEAGVLQSQLQPPLYFVPWVIINNVFSEDNLFSAMTDFKKVVCGAFTGTQPVDCLQ